MTARAEQPSSVSSPTLKKSPASARQQVRRFFGIVIAFIIGLAIVIRSADWMVGKWLENGRWRNGLIPEIHTASRLANTNNDSVRRIVLGDSVARQMFRHGTEPSPQTLYLATNRSLTLAGQLYLAESALAHMPNITDIYLFLTPQSVENDMPLNLTRDAFCSTFHEPRQVIEVFRVKRDVQLSLAHLGRWCAPNLMMLNSISRPAFSLSPGIKPQPAPPTSDPTPPEPDHLITDLSQWLAPPPLPRAPETGSSLPLIPSVPSDYFLVRLRRLCDAHGIRLHVLPCPTSPINNGPRYTDPRHIYDGKILGDFPDEQYIDTVHFKPQYLHAARDRVLNTYGVEILEPGKDAAQ